MMNGRDRVAIQWLVNTGWKDEARGASLAVRQAKAAARAEMFARQQALNPGDFIGNWYPRGNDGMYEDPHYGVSTRDAPYGYVEGTQTPRKEPLYDVDGTPIIPRTREEIQNPDTSWMVPRATDKSRVSDEAWQAQVDLALAKWGRFGRRAVGRRAEGGRW